MRPHRMILVAGVLAAAAAGWLSVNIAHADRTGASERLTTSTTSIATPSAVTVSPNMAVSATSLPTDTTSHSTAPPSTSPLVLAPAPAAAPQLTSAAQFIAGDVAGAAAYAQQQGYTTAITVIDTTSGAAYSAGDSTGYFASESVVKVLIATRLLIEGQMTGDTETTAYQMLTQSDDTSADELYGDVGGDDLINWADDYFGINIGTPPTQAGWWGNTHISSTGLAAFYAKIETNPTVWPWLSNAMANTTQYGSDGTYQWFGIPSAVSNGWMIKQGWGEDDDCACHATDNTTGYINHGHYVVVILLAGPGQDYGPTIADTLTTETKLLIPNGQID